MERPRGRVHRDTEKIHTRVLPVIGGMGAQEVVKYQRLCPSLISIGDPWERGAEFPSAVMGLLETPTP
jgi:hypothetical protein